MSKSVPCPGRPAIVGSCQGPLAESGDNCLGGWWKFSVLGRVSSPKSATSSVYQSGQRFKLEKEPAKTSPNHKPSALRPTTRTPKLGFSGWGLGSIQSMCARSLLEWNTPLPGSCLLTSQPEQTWFGGGTHHLRCCVQKSPEKFSQILCPPNHCRNIAMHAGMQQQMKRAVQKCISGGQTLSWIRTRTPPPAHSAPCR